MRKFLSLLLLVLSTQALGATTEYNRAQTERPRNMFSNPGFESGVASWTASGGSLSAVAVAGGEYGNLTGKWISSGSAQTLVSSGASYSTGGGPAGRSGVVSCALKCASGTCTHTMGIDDGSGNNYATPISIQTSTSQYIRNTINFTFPQTGATPRLIFTSVAVSEPGLFIDSCYMGLADGYNVSQVSQAQAYGTSSVTSCANPWNKATTSFAAYSTQTGCTYTNSGNNTAIASNLPGIRFPFLPPGDYLVTYDGAVVRSNTTDANGCFYKFTDGTNDAGIVYVNGPFSATEITSGPTMSGRFSYATAQGDTTFTIQAKSEVNTNPTCNIYGTSTYPGQFRVYYFPNSSQTGYRADTTPVVYSGAFASSCSWARTSSSIGDFGSGGGGCTLTQRQNVNAGSVSIASGTLPGIQITLPRAGQYWVCAMGGVNGSAATTTENVVLTDGATTISSVSSQTTATTQEMPFSVCGPYNATSAGQVTLKLQGAANSTNTVTVGNISPNALEMSVFEITAGMPMPLFNNVVVAQNAGATDIEYVVGNPSSTCSSGTCSTNRTSGGVTSVVWNSTGNYTVNFTAGTFSAGPSCTANGARAAGINCQQNGGATTTTTAVFNCYTGTTGVATNDNINVQCMGPH